VKVGIYALAKNESANVPAWEASCREADVRVVTDTGSTDNTVELLEAAGVTVARGAPVPWRWDDAHNLSLYHLPADVDVAIRLDLDEVLDPGWRAALEAAWKPETTNLRYWYQWSEAVRFMSDRVHRRAGYRWVGATHEGLACWSGTEVQAISDTFSIRHHRQPGKTHKTDLTLLRQAVREYPLDTRLHWYLARELDYAGDPEAAAAFERYLAMPGGSPTERAYSFRMLAKIEPAKAKARLLEAIMASPQEPEAFLCLAELAEKMGDFVSTLYYARHASFCPAGHQTHASDPRAYGPRAPDLACVAASRLGLHKEALQHAREAHRRDPSDGRMAENLALLERQSQEAGPKAA
jgi:tetratricopeptide (TPR) repeat protein